MILSLTKAQLIIDTLKKSLIGNDRDYKMKIITSENFFVTQYLFSFNNYIKDDYILLVK